MDTFILIGITGIGLGALYFLVACGLSLIYGLMGVLNFAHGAFLSVGAFAGYWFAVKLFPVTTNLSFALWSVQGVLRNLQSAHSSLRDNLRHTKV